MKFITLAEDLAASGGGLMLYVVVTGSRTWDNIPFVFAKLNEATQHEDLVTVVHGDCRHGADQIAQFWAEDQMRQGQPVNWLKFPATAEYGPWPARGPIRNRAMIRHVVGLPVPALCLAFIRDGSRGATGCALMAQEAGIPTIRYSYEECQ